MPASNVSAYRSNPFGDEYSASGKDDNTQHYAGLEHDAESGTDHAQFRQYNTNLGQWMSLDPYRGSYDFLNPQSYNRYTYAMDNPLPLIDSSGLQCVTLDNGAVGDDGTEPPCGAMTGGDSYYNFYASPLPWWVVEYGLMAGWIQSSGAAASSGTLAPSLGPLHLAPNSGLTKKQAACALDAGINGALSIFVPGYAATKALASFGGFSFNPVGALTGTSGLFSGGNPTPLQTAGGLAGANQIYQDSRFAAASGASALARVQDLTSRVGFGAQTASHQGRLLSQLGDLESLEGAASFASKANNVTAAISAGYDIYKCMTTP